MSSSELKADTMVSMKMEENEHQFDAWVKSLEISPFFTKYVDDHLATANDPNKIYDFADVTEAAFPAMKDDHKLKEACEKKADWTGEDFAIRFVIETVEYASTHGGKLTAGRSTGQGCHLGCISGVSLHKGRLER